MRNDMFRPDMLFVIREDARSEEEESHTHLLTKT